MKPCFINSLGCVSTQHTTDNTLFLDTIENYNSPVIRIIKPNYKEYIKGAAVRRMAKGAKMGVVASSIALRESNIDIPDAIITGTGMGCGIYSEKFLSAIIDNDEQFLTPTPFIQSTHNTVAAQIALGLQCKGYNFTYVNGGISFESSLIDAQLMLEEEDAQQILVGGVDEIAEHTLVVNRLVSNVKIEEDIPTQDILNSSTQGSVWGEGATFFMLSSQAQNAYAQLVDTAIFAHISKENVQGELLDFLLKNNTSIADIDLVVLGKNGDIRYDNYYQLFEHEDWKNTTQVAYKHLSGEYYTASAFGLWVACKVLKHQTIPSTLLLNATTHSPIKTVLLYNQYQGKDHSFVLLKAAN